MSVLRSPPCERRSAHSESDTIPTNNSSLSNQPLAVRSSGFMPLPANKSTKAKKINSLNSYALAAVSLSTVTTNTSTTTTATSTTTTTTTSSIFNPICIMSTTINTRTNAIDSNAQKEMQTTPKRTRSSPEKNLNNSNKRPKQHPTKQQQLTYWLSRPPTENRFDILAQESDLEESTNKEQQRPLPSKVVDQKKIPKPPPIYVQNVQYLSTLTNALNDSIQSNYELKVLNNNEIKIQTKESTHYTSTIKLLKERNTQYYTFRPKEEKGFKVMLRNMHHSTDKDDIISELAEYGHIVTNIHNIFKNGTKQPLSIFSVELKLNENNKDIYNLTSLLHCKIKFEPPHQKRTLPQCINCQKYGHTKNYCTRSPVCVKCAGPHKTANCTLNTNDDNIKCALCEEKHTANYKGCMVYKSLRVQRFPALRKKEMPAPQTSPNHQNNTSDPTRKISGTYAQIVAQTTNNKVTNKINTMPQNDDIQELKTMISQLINQMSNMMNIITLLVTKMDDQRK